MPATSPATDRLPPAPRRTRAAGLLALALLATFALPAADDPPAPQPPMLPQRIYEFLEPHTVLLRINGIDFLSDTFIDAALTQLPSADRNALIQAAQIGEELRTRNLAVGETEIDAAAEEFAATVNASRPDQPKLTPDQLLAVMGIERAMFRRYITRLAGLRKLLVADGQIPAGTAITAPQFQAASETYLKLLQVKFTARAGDGDVFLRVGQHPILKSEAVQQYRSAVWSKAYRDCPVEDTVARARAANDALNNDVLSIVDRILRYKVVYARWHALNRNMTQEFKDQVLQDLIDALAVHRGDLSSPQVMFEQFLRQRNQDREAFLQSYEFEMTCMLSQLVADRIEDPLLKAEFDKNPAAYGKGDPIVRLIFVPTRNDDGADLPRTEPTGLSSVDAAYEKIRQAASARAREQLRLAELAIAQKGFPAAADEFNQDPATRPLHGLIGRIPVGAKDPRFTPAMMAEIARLSALPAGADGKPVEGNDGWYRFQVDRLENPAFETVRRRVFLAVIGRERVRFQDQLLHDAKIDGLFGPAYRAFLDADWKSKYETPDLPPATAPAPEAHP